MDINKKSAGTQGRAPADGIYSFYRLLFATSAAAFDFAVAVVHTHVVLIWVVAGRACLRRRCAYVLVAAHEALPGDRLVAFPYCAVLYLLKVMKETAVVTGFDFGDCAEMRCYFGEAFFVGDLGGLGVEFDTFDFFFVCGTCEIVGRGADYASVNTQCDRKIPTFKEFEKDF